MPLLANASRAQRLESEQAFRRSLRKACERSIATDGVCSMIVVEMAPRDARNGGGQAARQILESWRQEPMHVGLLGDGRFGLLLPNVDSPQALAVAEDVCRRMGACGADSACSVFSSRPASAAANHPQSGAFFDPAMSLVGVRTPEVAASAAMEQGSSGSRSACPADAAWAGMLGDPLARAVPRWKRALDLLLAVSALLVAAPLFAVLALYIKKVSPGPVFYPQERVGLKGRLFKCLKFRSMHVRADTEVHKAYLEHLIHSNEAMTKLDSDGDGRLIPGGRWLRACGLDELPQLLNVLRGEMSIVGPRPCTVYEYEKFLPWHKTRFATLPGLTGLWQVSGKNRLTFNDMMYLDITYAKTKTLFMDLRILAGTPRAVVQQCMDLWRAKRGKR